LLRIPRPAEAASKTYEATAPHDEQKRSPESIGFPQAEQNRRDEPDSLGGEVRASEDVPLTLEVDVAIGTRRN
jgi:hypothetical protein